MKTTKNKPLYFLRRFLSFLFPLSSFLCLFGCGAILDGDIRVEAPHSATPYVRPQREQPEASSFAELKEAMHDLVMQHEESGTITYYSFETDVQEDIDRACAEIRGADPIGAYAVSEIKGLPTKIVSYHEVDVSIEYRRTKQQVESIVTVPTLKQLQNQLLVVMSDYQDEAVFRTTLRGVTAEAIDVYVKDTYYQNPRSIVMMPRMTVEIYPEGGSDRIFELSFSNILQSGILKQNSASLSDSVRRYAEAACGDNAPEMLLSLAKYLIGACVYDEGTAKVISDYGPQNNAATAYGALVTGSAVGEGFAMAYKALCEEIGFDCIIVLGHLDGMVHAWNIVTLDKDSYHIDLSMCAANGIETAFLKTDADFIQSSYEWDTKKTVSCHGALTYEDVAGPEMTDGEEQPADSDTTATGGENDENGAEANNAENESENAGSDSELASPPAKKTPPPPSLRA